CWQSFPIHNPIHKYPINQPIPFNYANTVLPSQAPSDIEDGHMLTWFKQFESQKNHFEHVSDFELPLVDETNPRNVLVKKMSNDLKPLNSLLQKSSTRFYYDQTEPSIADYFVFEAFTASRDYCQKLLPNAEDC
ncbi:unnamed protein product, partial [Rotaria magnacalcarata]